MSRQKIILTALGTLPVTKAFLGNVIVMNAAAIDDDFSRPDGLLAGDGRWIDYGPSTDYRAVIEDNKVRIGIPDNLTEPVERVSYTRCATGVSGSEDGHIECRVFTRGDSVSTVEGAQRYYTAVFAKVDNDGFADGVGMHLAASHLNLVVRRAGVDTVIASFGTYAPGDILRMEFTGRLYTFFCNGRSRGSWSDGSGLVATGAGHRSLGVRVHGAQEQSGVGPRRFSPALDYVEYG